MPHIKPIAIVQGGSGRLVQRLFGEFIDREREKWRLAGVIERGHVDDACRKAVLQHIGDGRTYSLFQDLGPASQACAMRTDALVRACQHVCDHVADGCDLVLLSKFGKLEAEERSGLTAAFAAAMEADVPVLTSVAPKFGDAWERFAAPYFMTLPPEMDAITDWWKAVCGVGSAASRYD